MCQKSGFGTHHFRPDSKPFLVPSIRNPDATSLDCFIAIQFLIYSETPKTRFRLLGVARRLNLTRLLVHK